MRNCKICGGLVVKFNEQYVKCQLCGHKQFYYEEKEMVTPKRSVYPGYENMVEFDQENSTWHCVTIGGDTSKKSLRIIRSQKKEAYELLKEAVRNKSNQRTLKKLLILYKSLCSQELHYV